MSPKKARELLMSQTRKLFAQADRDDAREAARLAKVSKISGETRRQKHADKVVLSKDAAEVETLRKWGYKAADIQQLKRLCDKHGKTPFALLLMLVRGESDG